MNQPPFFNTQFSGIVTDGVAAVAAGYLLYTWESGTTTEAPTYQDQAGASANTNPIVLDDDGRCNLWLEPGFEYTLELRTPLGSVVRTWDNISGAAGTTTVVTEVNGKTGAVTLTADDIGYAGGGSFSWLSASDVGAALDEIAGRVDAPPAESVTVVDAAELFEGTNVEEILEELGERKLPAFSDKAGRVLTNDGTTLSWQIGRTHWRLALMAGLAGTRSVRLPVGTYQVTLDSRCYVNTPTGPFSIKQAASIGDVDLEAVMEFNRSGGSGHGYQIHATGLDVKTLVVGTEADFTMTVETMETLGVAVGKGSILTVERL